MLLSDSSVLPHDDVADFDDSSGYAPLVDWVMTMKARKHVPRRLASLCEGGHVDLSRHLHRLYFAGCNSPSAPLTCPTAVPPELLPWVHQDRFEVPPS